MLEGELFFFCIFNPLRTLDRTSQVTFSSLKILKAELCINNQVYYTSDKRQLKIKKIKLKLKLN